MDALDILHDLTTRPRDAAAALRTELNPVTLNARPGGHDNSVAWLLWHTGREVDVQLADLSGTQQVWHAGSYAERFDLGEAGDAVGYGHTPEQARRIIVEDGAGLLEYVDATLAELDGYLGTLTADDLEEIVDPQWDPPVTRGARLVSILDDAIQHLAQAAYALGMPQPS
ncbi:mycothiol transferase [Brachybacterium sp. AOP43-C2-M15]|uniref:mycothiol transferase n=1 Tax=Brachybacterium sp. AOP43-C2-M15 TaxID=3457661 RepID=UPI0040331EC6